MLKIKLLFKLILSLLVGNTVLYSCPVYSDPIPIADTYITVDAKENKTSFDIRWKFKEFFIMSLLEDHDLNKNGIFDKNEQDDIKKDLISYIENNNNITEVVYTKKGQRTSKSLMSKIELTDSKLIFDGETVEYVYSFDTDFIITHDHRLFIRFLDPKERIQLNIGDITIENYSGKKVIRTQAIRAHIYFYDYKRKYRKGDISTLLKESKKIDEEHKGHGHKL